MDALVMCGGAGMRLDRGEKPLFEVGGKPMLERVLTALESSEIETIYAVTSPQTPKTTRWVNGQDGVGVLEADGEGYVADLTSALERVERPVLTVVSDLPLLAGEIVDRTIEVYEAGALTVCVPASLKRQLGVSVETTRAHGGTALSPTGLNVVSEGDTETIRVSYDARLAVNVNRPEDVTAAEALADIETDSEVIDDGS